MPLDLFRLTRTLGFLLRNGPQPGLEADEEGWCGVDELARAASSAIHRPVGPEDIKDAIRRFGARVVELDAERVRACGATPPPGRGPCGPDILYHATPRTRIRTIQQRGALASPGGGPVHLSRLEDHAWRIAHRQWDDPVVLYVDAARARRDGVQFQRTRSGQYAATAVPLRHVLNLRDGFAEQASAGGFLVDWTTGSPRIALIRVVRRGGATWEVAKGKIEPGEAPETAAVREVREEMGVHAEIHVRGTLGTIRYGFCTPDGSPRLKTIYLYVLESEVPLDQFAPALDEGIDAVRWFDLDDALECLGHPSLRSSIGRLVAALEQRAAELGLPRAVGA